MVPFVDPQNSHCQAAKQNTARAKQCRNGILELEIAHEPISILWHNKHNKTRS